MKIDKRKHLAFLKRKCRELNRLYLHQLRYGRASLQYIRDIAFVISTLLKEIKFLESDVKKRNVI